MKLNLNSLLHLVTKNNARHYIIALPSSKKDERLSQLIDHFYAEHDGKKWGEYIYNYIKVKR